MQEFDPRRLRSTRYAPRALVVAAGFAALAAGWQITDHDKAQATVTKAALDPASLSALQHVAFAQSEARPGFARTHKISVKVRPGETLEDAVLRIGVSATDAQAVVNAVGQAVDTVNIKAGMALDAAVARPRDTRGPVRLIGLSMKTGPASALTLSRTFDGALRLREMEEKISEETAVAQGEMHGSLYESAMRAGATPAITAEVVKLFAHKVDFTRDIKRGDEFRLVFDRTVTESGRTLQVGELKYAELDAKGQRTRFYRFKQAGSATAQFFDETGKNIRGFLLRTPVDGARITSSFGMRRHPILGYNRMHQGIDFGAGSGTPVLAAGEGTVVEARRWAGYGNWVRVRHNGGWETGYAHLSRFAAGLRPGDRVGQGELIGYVGSTGRSTGPHLHYEIWRNGKRVNPKGAKVPQGTILAGRDLAAFRAEVAQINGLIAKADKAETTRMAAAAAAGLRAAR